MTDRQRNRKAYLSDVDEEIDEIQDDDDDEILGVFVESSQKVDEEISSPEVAHRVPGKMTIDIDEAEEEDEDQVALDRLREKIERKKLIASLREKFDEQDNARISKPLSMSLDEHSQTRTNSKGLTESQITNSGFYDSSKSSKKRKIVDMEPPTKSKETDSLSTPRDAPTSSRTSISSKYERDEGPAATLPSTKREIADRLFSSNRDLPVHSFLGTTSASPVPVARTNDMFDLQEDFSLPKQLDVFGEDTDNALAMVHDFN
jgi:hypothetical protein